MWIRNGTEIARAGYDVICIPAMRRAVMLAAEKIYGAAIEAVSPYRLVTSAVSFNPADKTLAVSGRSLQVDRNVKVVAFGKAVLGMVAAVEGLLGEHVVEGVASVPVGAVERARRQLPHWNTPSLGSKTRVYEGAVDNLPDAQAASAAQDVLQLARGAGRGEVLLVLMSGGGSALLPCPVEGVSLEEKRTAVELLSKRGGTIEELNTLRKALSLVKGGRLAEAAFPAQVVSLILSDVVGDKLAVISSGPTVPRETQTSGEALKVIHRYTLEENMPKSVLKYLQDSQTHNSEWNAGSHQIMENGEYSHIQNVVIGSNKLATKAAECVAEEMGYRTLVWSHRMQGEARLVGVAYARLFHSLAKNQTQTNVPSLLDQGPFIKLFNSHPTLRDDFASVVAQFTACESHRPLCLISAGEPTVSVKGHGRGGRNQELALAVALEMSELCQTENMATHTSCQTGGCRSKWSFFSVGTDGQDGPCDAAGAMVNDTTVSEALEQRLSPHPFLADNDSYSFFSALSEGSCIIKTGLTGTNVMDLHVFLLH